MPDTSVFMSAPPNYPYNFDPNNNTPFWSQYVGFPGPYPKPLPTSQQEHLGNPIYQTHAPVPLWSPQFAHQQYARQQFFRPSGVRPAQNVDQSSVLPGTFAFQPTVGVSDSFIVVRFRAQNNAIEYLMQNATAVTMLFGDVALIWTQVPQVNHEYPPNLLQFFFQVPRLGRQTTIRTVQLTLRIQWPTGLATDYLLGAFQHMPPTPPPTQDEFEVRKRKRTSGTGSPEESKRSATEAVTPSFQVRSFETGTPVPQVEQYPVPSYHFDFNERLHYQHDSSYASQHDFKAEVTKAARKKISPSQHGPQPPKRSVSTELGSHTPSDLAVQAPVPAEPVLVRTSIMEQSRHLPSSFNPYSIYPNNKAKLELVGDLNDMQQGWSKDELEGKRRLVRFHRGQFESLVKVSFQAVAQPSKRATGVAYISCMWWERKNSYWVTSVGTIDLLQCILGVRFTVEEKNRIRRNLEGFHPMTISKTRKETEDFFKTIMGYPEPRPRNIEKDIKVFRWEDLSDALHRVVDRYSASYASTAGVLKNESSSDSSQAGSESPSEPTSYTLTRDNSGQAIPTPSLEAQSYTSEESLSYFETPPTTSFFDPGLHLTHTHSLLEAVSGAERYHDSEHAPNTRGEDYWSFFTMDPSTSLAGMPSASLPATTSGDSYDAFQFTSNPPWTRDDSP